MNLQDLVEVAQKKLLNETGDIVSKSKLTIAFNCLFDTIREISAVEDVQIYKFGTFSRKEVDAKTVTTRFTEHLPTGSVEVENHIVPKFKPSKQYKSALRYGKVE